MKGVFRQREQQREVKRERERSKEVKGERKQNNVSAGCCMSASVRGSIWWPGASMSEMRGGEPAEPINYGPSSPTLH